MAKKVKLNRNETSTFTDTEQLYNKTKEQLNKLDFGEVTVGSTDNGDEIFLGVKGKNGKGTILSNYHGDNAISVASNYIGLKIDNTTYNDNVLKVSDKGLYVRKSETGVNTGDGTSYSFNFPLIENSGIVSLVTGVGINGNGYLGQDLSVAISSNDDNILKVDTNGGPNNSIGSLYVSKQEIKSLVGGVPGPSGSYSFVDPLYVDGTGTNVLLATDGTLCMRTDSHNELSVKLSTELQQYQLIRKNADGLMVDYKEIIGLATGYGLQASDGYFNLRVAISSKADNILKTEKLSPLNDSFALYVSRADCPGGGEGGGSYLFNSPLVEDGGVVSISTGDGIGGDRKLQVLLTDSDDNLLKIEKGALMLDKNDIPGGNGGGKTYTFTGDYSISLTNTASGNNNTIGVSLNIDKRQGNLLKYEYSTEAGNGVRVDKADVIDSFSAGTGIDLDKNSGQISVKIAGTSSSLTNNLLKKDNSGALYVDPSELPVNPGQGGETVSYTGNAPIEVSGTKIKLNLTEAEPSGLTIGNVDHDPGLKIQISSSTKTPLMIYKDGLSFDYNKITGGLKLDASTDGSLSLNLKEDGPLVLENDGIGRKALTIDQSKLTYNGPTYSGKGPIQVSGTDISLNLADQSNIWSGLGLTGRDNDMLTIKLSASTKTPLKLFEDGLGFDDNKITGGLQLDATGTGELKLKLKDGGPLIVESGTTGGLTIDQSKLTSVPYNGPTYSAGIGINIGATNAIAVDIKTGVPCYGIAYETNKGVHVLVDPDLSNALKITDYGLYVPQQSSGPTYSPGSGINISGNTISAKVQTNKGIENNASTGLGIKIPTNSGLQLDGNGLSFKLASSTPFKVDDAGFNVKFKDNTINATEDGLYVKISGASGNQLTVDSAGLYVPASSGSSGGSSVSVSTSASAIHFGGDTLKTTKINNGYAITTPSGLTEGVEYTLIIYNSGSSSITITMPSGSSVYKNVSSISIPSGSYGEVSCVRAGQDYWIRAAV